MPVIDDKLRKTIESKLKALNELRPLPAAAVQKIKDQFRMEMVYHSNAIEGNSLTLKETQWVINEGITIKGKPLKDHLEAKNHLEALNYLDALVGEGKGDDLSEGLIRSIHQLVVMDTDKEWAGRNRNSNVYIAGASHTPPDALDVPHDMADLIDWFKQNRKTLSAIELAARLHHRLVQIHPFFDGNRRTARLVMNIVLMQAGYPLVVILKHDRKKYDSALSKADKGSLVELTRLVAMAVMRSLDIYLKTLTPSSMKREMFIPLSEASEGTPYSAKYLNLLARQGKLEAHKEGRN